MSKMKKTFLAILALPVLAAVLSLQSCTRDMCEVTMTYTKYTPIYMSYDALRAPDAVKATTPIAMKNPGKIYVKNNYLFVNEYRKGIHVIDNSNPSAPQMVSFITIPGNRDLAVYGDILYADSHVDIVAIDIHDPANPVVVARQQDILPYDNYENYTYLDPALGVVNEWNEEEVTETMMTDCRNSGGMGPDGPNQGELQAFGGSGASGGSNKNPMTAGKGGSMARFTIFDHYLYAVTENDMKVFDVNGGTLNHFSDVNLGSNVETVFPYDNMLFVGTTTGMLIYNNSNPAAPYEVGSYSHITSCDPVVVEGTHAYVTLRGGNPCGINANTLEVVDISQPTNPTQVAVYAMTEPYGLGVDANSLFVCDGSGVQIFNATDPSAISKVGTAGTSKAFDVIPFNNILYVIAADGLFQYDYTNPASPQLLSRIPVTQ